MKVLLPVDGSEPSLNTAEWVADMLNPQKTDLLILTVVHKTVPELVVEEYQVEDALQTLERFKKLMTQKGFSVSKAEYLTGDPAQSICDYATEQKVDQIVLGSHGRSGLGRVLLGSVSQAVFECAKQPVFIVKNQQTQPVSP